VYVWNRDRNNCPAIQNARCRYVDSERHPGIPSAGAEHRGATSKLWVERSACSFHIFSGTTSPRERICRGGGQNRRRARLSSVGSIEAKRTGIDGPRERLKLGDHNVPLPPKSHSSNRKCCWFSTLRRFHSGSALRPASMIIGLISAQRWQISDTVIILSS